MAIEKKKLDCVRYLAENICLCNYNIKFIAVKCCDLQTLKCLYDNDIIRFDDDKLLYSAILSQYTNVVKYIIDKGCPITNTIMMQCARHDKIIHLKYFHKIYNMYIDRNLINTILKYDSIKCLKYQSKNNFLITLDNLDLKNSGKKCRVLYMKNMT